MSGLLASLPPLVLIVTVVVIVAVESIGIPLPGETVVVAAVLVAQHDRVPLWWIFAAAVVGATLGDSVGYALGRVVGIPLLEYGTRRAPLVFRTSSIVAAARLMVRYGGWAVFLARFIALLRMFAGPLSGALGLPYPRFLVANAAGSTAWAALVVLGASLAGAGAQALGRSSPLLLGGVVLLAAAAFLFLRRRRRTAAHEDRTADERPLSEQIAEIRAGDPRMGRPRSGCRPDLH